MPSIKDRRSYLIVLLIIVWGILFLTISSISPSGFLGLILWSPFYLLHGLASVFFLIDNHEWLILAVGTVLCFAVAFLFYICIRWYLKSSLPPWMKFLAYTGLLLDSALALLFMPVVINKLEVVYYSQKEAITASPDIFSGLGVTPVYAQPFTNPIGLRLAFDLGEPFHTALNERGAYGPNYFFTSPIIWRGNNTAPADFGEQTMRDDHMREWHEHWIQDNQALLSHPYFGDSMRVTMEKSYGDVSRWAPTKTPFVYYFFPDYADIIFDDAQRAVKAVCLYPSILQKYLAPVQPASPLHLVWQYKKFVLGRDELGTHTKVDLGPVLLEAMEKQNPSMLEETQWQIIEANFLPENLVRLGFVKQPSDAGDRKWAVYGADCYALP